MIFSPVLEELNEGVKSQSMIAKACTSQQWKSVVTGICWCVKWTMNGLMPVRPVVCFTRPFALSPGQSVLIDTPTTP